MTGEDLGRYSFGDACVFEVRWTPEWVGPDEELVEALPRRPGVYAITKGARFGRLVGSSDIVYIGCTHDLRARIQTYYEARTDEFLRHSGGTESTTARIADLLDASAGISNGRKTWDAPSEISVLGLAWVVTRTHGAAKQLEADLLREYLHQHRELPPANRQLGSEVLSNRVLPVRTSVGTGWIEKEAVNEVILDELLELRTLYRSVRRIYGSPSCDYVLGIIATNGGETYWVTSASGPEATSAYDKRWQTVATEKDAVALVLKASRIPGTF